MCLVSYTYRNALNIYFSRLYCTCSLEIEWWIQDFLAESPVPKVGTRTYYFWLFFPVNCIKSEKNSSWGNSAFSSPHWIRQYYISKNLDKRKKETSRNTERNPLGQKSEKERERDGINRWWNRVQFIILDINQGFLSSITFNTIFIIFSRVFFSFFIPFTTCESNPANATNASASLIPVSVYLHISMKYIFAGR